MSLVAQFLTQIRHFVCAQQADSLRSWLQVDPDSAASYHALAAELRAQSASAPDSIDTLVEHHLPVQDPVQDPVPDGHAAVWPSFQALMKDYLVLWRDMSRDNLPRTHELLTSLVKLYFRPQLVRHGLCPSNLRGHAAPDQHVVFRHACPLHAPAQQASRPGAQAAAGGRGERRQVGRGVVGGDYPENLHDVLDGPFGRAGARGQKGWRVHVCQLGVEAVICALCLEQAYLQTPPQLVSHRTNILTYLIPCNMLLGRFPSDLLMQRPEARPLRAVFPPLCRAVRSGNVLRFQAHLAHHEAWLFERGLLLALAYRLRPLLWRSLARKTFLLTYVPPADATSRKAATLDIAHLHSVAVYLQRRLEGWLPAHPPHAARGARPSSQANPLLRKAVANSVQEPPGTTLAPPPGGPKKLRPNEGLVWGNAEITLEDVEMVVATLVQQGLMHGFVAHGQARFAIIGAKAKGPVVAGWPVVWQAIQERRYEEEFDMDHVPGWVKG